MQSVTHQHPLQTAKVVPLSLPVYRFLEADGVSQPHEFLTDIYSLGKTRHFKGGVYLVRETKAEDGERQLTLPSLMS